MTDKDIEIKELEERIENLKYGDRASFWEVKIYTPSCESGSTEFKKIKLDIDRHDSREYAEDIISDFCYQKFGKRIGVYFCPFQRWSFKKISSKSFGFDEKPSFSLVLDDKYEVKEVDL